VTYIVTDAITGDIFGRFDGATPADAISRCAIREGVPPHLLCATEERPADATCELCHDAPTEPCRWCGATPHPSEVTDG
jgi:hypothetical protein